MLSNLGTKQFWDRTKRFTDVQPPDIVSLSKISVRVPGNVRHSIGLIVHRSWIVFELVNWMVAKVFLRKLKRNMWLVVTYSQEERPRNVAQEANRVIRALNICQSSSRLILQSHWTVEILDQPPSSSISARGSVQVLFRGWMVRWLGPAHRIIIGEVGGHAW